MAAQREGYSLKLVKVDRGIYRIIAALLTAPLLIGFATGCGDFWKAPNGGSGSTSTGTTASTTSLTASTTTPVEGTTVTLTATVSPATATGTVTFFNGASSIGTETLTNGTATDSISFTSAG